MWISKIFSWVSLTGLLWACPVLGQAAKPQRITEKDYELWSTMLLQGASDDGQYISYGLAYASGQDTLFVRTAEGKMVFALPKGYRSGFGKGFFACLLPQGRMAVGNLKSRTVSTWEGVDDYEPLENGKLLILKDGRAAMEVVDRNGKVIHRVSNVAEYAVSLGRDEVAVSTKNNGGGLWLLPVNGNPKYLIASGTEVFSKLRWESSGRWLAFASFTPEGRASGVSLFTAKTKSVVRKAFADSAAPSSIAELVVSPDGKRVAVSSVEIQTDSLAGAIPEVWNAKDAVPYSSRPRFSTRMRGWVWFTETAVFREVTDARFTSVQFGGDLRYALLENPLANRPSFKPEADRDLFVRDVETRTTHPFLLEFSGQAERIAISPDGRGVCYFDADHWHYYDFRTRKHRSLTGDLGVRFGDEDNDRPEANRPYALPVWSADGNTLYVYDKFDIWTIDQKGCKRLTRGREQSLVFRFAFAGQADPNGLVCAGARLDGTTPALLIARKDDHAQSGYFELTQTGMRPLLLTNKRTARLKVSGDGKRLFCTEEDFDMPPRIMMLDRGSGKATTLFASNGQQDTLRWGRSELITYKNGMGRALKATLFYPAGYDPAKTYPMVVHIYERQRASLHEYVNPSLKESDGFNRTNFTLQGYFVLYPDIVHRIGDPAASAVDCVESAVRKVLLTVPVDPARLGIIGHSMGGYLVNCIVTHSSLFKAAVSGAGIADTASWYHSMGYNTGIPDASRFEYEQMRIGKPFFEDKEAYRRNSPIEFAANMSSALLLWTGENDTQVKPWQSMEFHMALRRLGKENTLLVYPGEDHALSLEKNQIDLMTRIEGWFRKYLKPAI